MKDSNPVSTLNPTEKVNHLFDKYEKHFPNCFLHTLLWNLLVKKTRKMEDAAFTPVIQRGFTVLGIADRGMKGYTPTTAIFATRNHDEALEICKELNQDIFGIDDETAMDIIITTIRNDS